MKPLQTLDRVMLCVARIFSALYLIFGILLVVSVCAQLLRFPPSKVEVLLVVSSASLFFIGTWFSVGSFWRIFVAFGAFIFGVRDILFVLGNLFSISIAGPSGPGLFTYHHYMHMDALSFALIFGVPLFGYFSIAWTAVRQPQQSCLPPTPI